MSDHKDKGNDRPEDKDPRRIPDGHSDYEKKGKEPGDIEKRNDRGRR